MGTPYNFRAPGMGQQLPQQPAMQVPMTMLPPPQAPVPMRSPMAALPSHMNHSYDAGLGFGAGLAGRAPVPKGRSGYNLDRIAAQKYRQTHNPQMLQSQQWYHLNADRMGNPNGPADGMTPMPAPAPAAASEPGGHFVEGRTPGAWQWMPDAPATLPGDAGGLMPNAGGGMPSMPDQPAPQVPQTPQAQQPFGFPMPPLPWDGKGPLPPSTLGGGTGVPPPQDPEPFVPTPEYVKQFNLQPDFSKTQVWNGRHYPTWKTATPKPEVWQLYDEPGPAVENPLTKKMEPGPTIKRQVNTSTGETRDLIPEGGKRDAGGEGGYDPFAKKQPAVPPTPTPPPPAAKTPAGTPAQASTQTGVMPNVGYANDMSPEQNLAAAREYYAQTGDDSKIREHFQSHPSQAMQLLQQEQKLWQQIGENSQADGATLEKRAADQRLRNEVLNATTPILQGTAAQLYDLVYPEQARNLGAPARLNTQTNADLMDRANELSRQYDAQRASDRLAIQEEDFKRAWDLYKKTGRMSMLSDYTKGGEA